MKDITCFNIKPGWYIASEDGNIYVKHNMLKRKAFPNSCGYKLVALSCDGGKLKGFLLHRVILQTFKPIENPEKFQVNHIDGNKSNNHINNLEWVSQSDNMKHAYATGLETAIKGENSSVSNFSNDFVELLCNIMEQHYVFSDILKELNKYGYYIVYFDKDIERLRGLISTIRSENAWVDISKKYNIIKQRKIKYGAFGSEETIRLVCNMIVNGYNNREICDKIFNKSDNSSQAFIRSIRRGDSYRYISKDYW